MIESSDVNKVYGCLFALGCLFAAAIFILVNAFSSGTSDYVEQGWLEHDGRVYLVTPLPENMTITKDGEIVEIREEQP